MRKYYLIILLIVIGCKNKDIEKIGSKDIINIGEGENINFSQIIDSITYITLETTEIVGDISKMKISDEGFFIHDEISKSILKFDTIGNFIYKINRQGRGPGEYIMITDYLVNFKGGVEIIDIGSHQRLWFDQNGSYLKETEIHSMDISHYYLNNSLIVGNHHPGAREKSNYYFHLWDENLAEQIDQELLFEPYRDKYLNGNIYPFSKYGKTLNFCSDYSNIVYSIDEVGGIKPKYELNFTYYDWQSNSIYKKFYDNTVFEWSKAMYPYVQFLRFIEAEQQAYIGFYVEGNRYNTFYDKAKKTSICVKNFIDDIDLGITNFEIVGYHNGFWYAIANTYQLDNIDMLINKGIKMSEDNPFIILKFKLI